MAIRRTFADRTDAGRRLAEALLRLPAAGDDLVVVGLPRGGVPVAAEVAAALGAELDVIIIRKLGAPRQPELAMGAIGEAGVRVMNRDVVAAVGATADDVAAIESREGAELARRAVRYRAGRERVSLAGRRVVIVDDGIATGATAKAACEVARAEGAVHITLAVPVAPVGWEDELGPCADRFVAVETPLVFHGVGQAYADFRQTTDEEVLACLDPS